MTKQEKVERIAVEVKSLSNTKNREELLAINEIIANELKECKFHPEQHNIAYDMIDYLKEEMDIYAEKKAAGEATRAAKNDAGIPVFFILPGILSMAEFD